MAETRPLPIVLANEAPSWATPLLVADVMRWARANRSAAVALANVLDRSGSVRGLSLVMLRALRTQLEMEG